MKTLITLLLSMTLICGCATNKVHESQNNDTPDYSEKDNPGDTGMMQDWYTNFETALKDQNFNYSSKEQLDASSVRGTEGYRYITEQGNIDIYRYEDGTDLDAIMQDKTLTVDGQKRNVEVNGNYVIVSDGVNEDILDIFRNMN